MNKRILNKKIKRENKDRINKILEELDYKVVKKYFGDGYFIFTFQKCSVSWFYLNEFPNWKFGIWLNDKNGYSIFGEHEYLIDKFKPTRTYLSEIDVSKFNKKLNEILNKEEMHLEYLEDAEEAFQSEVKTNGYNQKKLNCIRDFIKNYNKNNKNIGLKLIDRGYRTYPRYEIIMFYFEEKDLLNKEAELELILELSNSLDLIYEEQISGDTYIINFSKISTTLMSKQEFEQSNIDYDWNYKDYSEYILEK